MWKIRRAFWNWLTVKKFRANEEQYAPLPTESARKLRTIPMRVRYPGIPIDNILVANHVPDDEYNRFRLGFCRVQAFLYRVFPPGQPGLPSISSDPSLAMASAYGRTHRKSKFPVPALPEEYRGQINLGQLAVAGPYSYYLQAVDASDPLTSYEWDFRDLGRYEHHQGLRSLGVRVRFEVDDDQRGLSAVEIDCELGVVTPSHPLWEQAQRLALAAATNHLTLVRHFNWVHLAAVAQSSVASRNWLPAGHRLNRLLWPHQWGTQYSNELVTEILLMKGGDYESVFSFTHDGLCHLLSDTYGDHDIAAFDPDADADRRGLSMAPFDQPSLENRRAHFDVMYRHAQRYLHVAYPSDAALRADPAVVAWIADLNRRLPGGVGGVVSAQMTVDEVARLAAILMFVGTVEHDIMGSGLWNYQVWPHVQPVRVRRDGRRVPVDVYQRLVNVNLMLNVQRTPILHDFGYLAVDQAGRAAFDAFRADLEELEAKIRKEEHAYWRVSPEKLEASVNG